MTAGDTRATGLQSLFATLRRWFDNAQAPPSDLAKKEIDWLRCLPFVLLHLACVAAFYVGVSKIAVLTAVLLYAVRMFAITAFYHRYFSHRSFRTSRPMQFVFAFIGATATQRGPLWWAGHHRNHHRTSDDAEDIHSPRHHGMLWSHLGWIMSKENFATPVSAVPDLVRYPELRFLDRFDTLAPMLLAGLLYGAGSILEHLWPELGTSGPQLLVWGYFISTVVLFHATCTINSLSHRFGSRRFETADDSRNNPWLAALTFGEGWHNNHHHYPHSARSGFEWYEIDITYLGLRLLERLGLIRELRPVPAHVRPGSSALDPPSEST